MEKINIEITMDDDKVMKAVLFPEVAPITVENFVKLIKDEFFDGLIFHRVISGFMIQGGGMYPDGRPKETESIKGEFKSNGFDNKLLHTRGVLSMARTMFPNSASSQFFIMHQDAPHLDGQYAAFGMLTDGFEVLDEIADTVTDYTDKPVKDCVIKSIRLA